jgi:hypothetical protein
MKQKVVGREQAGERDRERERDGDGDREWLKKGCGMGHKLDHWSIIYERGII